MSTMTLAETIIENLRRRRGFDRAFDLDDDILEEIKQEMADAIDAHLREAAKGYAMHADPRAESGNAEEIAQWLYANGYHVAAYTIRSQLDVRNNRIRELEAVTPTLASARLPDSPWLDRHQIAAGRCPPQSMVVLVSSIRRMLAAPKRGEG